MRIKIIQKPEPASIDGLLLDRFEPGFEYEVGTALGCLFLAERWAVPVVTEEPALLVPLRETDASVPLDTWPARSVAADRRR